MAAPPRIAAEDAYPVWSPTKTTVVWYGQGPLKLSDLMKDREVIGIDFSAYENGSFPKQPSKVAWEGSAEAQHILEGFAAMKTPPEPIFEVTTVNASEAQLSDHSKGKRRKIQKGVIIKVDGIRFVSFKCIMAEKLRGEPKQQ